jgi:GntR family transcriptional regulator
MNKLFLDLHRRIQSGEYRPGDKLPGLDALMTQAGVSEAEARRALAELVYEGVIERERPAPAEVLQVPAQALWGTLTGNHSITKEAKRRGLEPGVAILSFETSPAWPALAERLQLEVGAAVVVMERLRSASGEPVAIEVSYFPAKYYPGITPDMFTESGTGQSSFEVMEKTFGLKSARAADEVTVVCLEQREAGLLGLAPGTPVLLRFRVTCSDQGVPIKASRAVWKFRAGYQMSV